MRQPEQKARWLPDLLAGRNAISLGMSEPEAGSAATELRTSAKFDGDHYIVNGSKVFGTHSAEATLYLIYLRFGPGLDGIGSMLIERGTPGFEIGKASRFMNGEEWSALYFENCRVPKENLLLGPGGFKKQIAAFNAERIGNTALARSRRPLRLRTRPRACRRPHPVRPHAQRVPGPAVEVRRHGAEAGGCATAAVPCRC